MSAALDVRPHIGDKAYVLLKPLHSSAKIKILKRTLLTVQNNVSEKNGMNAISFVIHGVTGSKLVHHGNIDFGAT